MNKNIDKTIMVINDDITQLSLISGIMMKMDYNVVTFTEAEKFLASISSGKNMAPDLVVTDLNMPGIDGWKLCGMMKSDEYPEMNSVPIIAVSAVFTADDAEKISMDIGADAFLSSPIDGEHLLNTVESLLLKKSIVPRPEIHLTGFSREQSQNIRHSFEKKYDRISVADNLSELLNRLENDLPDTIIICLNSGYNEITEKIIKLRKEKPGMIVIGITGEHCDIQPSEILKMGVDLCEDEPVDPEYLLVLNEKLRKERALIEIESLLQKRTFELQESRGRYESIMNSMTEPVYICSCNYIIEYANSAMKELAGEDPVGKTCFKTIFSQNEVCPWCKNREAMKNSVRFEAVSENKKMIFDISGAPVKRGSERASVQYVLRNITKQRELEERIRHNQKLEGIGQLAGGIAHDFNNLLGGIMGNADILDSKLDGNEKLKKYTERILHSSEKGADLVSSLLNYARRGKYKIEITDVHEILLHVINMLKHSVDKKIHLTKKFHSGRLLVNGDDSQLENMFLNIALNAREAMPDGGEMRFTTEIVHLDKEFIPFKAEKVVPGEYVMITVSDTGNGIPDKIRDRIFEPFFTTKDVDKGTGLGLSSVLGTAEVHKGYLKVDSKNKKGTDFKVYLPLSPENADKENKEACNSKAKNRTANVLLIDDEQEIRILAEEMLVMSGYNVKSFDNGIEGVEYFKKEHEKIDAVILDMIMPDISGFECLREMREIKPKIKAVLSTGYAAKKEMQRAVSEGFDYCLEKPFTRIEISNAVDSVLTGNSEKKQRKV